MRFRGYRKKFKNNLPSCVLSSQITTRKTHTCISCGKVQTMFLVSRPVTRSVVIQTRVGARFWEWSNQSNSRQLISLFAARHADILQTWWYTCRETLIARAAARTRTLPRRPCRSRTIAHVDVVLLVAKCVRHRYYKSIILNFMFGRVHSAFE